MVSNTYDAQPADLEANLVVNIVYFSFHLFQNWQHLVSGSQKSKIWFEIPALQ